ncbi:hypothetical protein ACO0LM_11950 [Undibacterium sp. Di26W]|uniref:hypothetical protein n=1 Tax=Undibacterium sp. Di26W TaxID=3413035 RepID=UPI003BF0D662
MSMSEIRLANVRLLIKEYGNTTRLAEKLELSGPSYLSQIAGANPIRTINEKKAREMEEKLGLVENWMDSPQTMATYRVAGEKKPKTTPTVAYTAAPAARAEVYNPLRLESCVELVITHADKISSKQTAKIILNAYNSGKNGEELARHIADLVELTSSI